jgi:hypothetical protein
MNRQSHSGSQKSRRRFVVIGLLAGALIPVTATLGIAVLTQVLSAGGCSSATAAPSGAAAVPAGPGTIVGASLYGPPGVDPTVHGNSGAYATLRPGDIAGCAAAARCSRNCARCRCCEYPPPPAAR